MIKYRLEVNPARAGMILAGFVAKHSVGSKPRASGDDPAQNGAGEALVV